MNNFYKHTVEVYRHVYEDKKSSKILVWTYKWLLKQKNPRYQQYAPETFGKAYNFTTEYGADIKESDEIRFDGDVFTVEGVNNKQEAINLKFTRVTLVKNV